MFKLVLACFLVAAYASEAPAISLDLDGSLRKTNSRGFASERKANTKYVHHCAAKSNGKTACALPKAAAYDHHDSDVKVSSSICLINKAPKNGGAVSKMDCTVAIDYNLRSEYIIKYDAQDDSGNNADQVIFAIILDDTTKPKFVSHAVFGKKAGGCHERHITNTFHYFNSGSAKGCEHRTHYLYEYRGTDCVWTSRPTALKSLGTYTYEWMRVEFKVADYGKLEYSDYVKVEMAPCLNNKCERFYPTELIRGDTKGNLGRRSIHDVYHGWYWQTVRQAKGRSANWMYQLDKHHNQVRVRITLKSNSDYAERHILDNLEIKGWACTKEEKYTRECNLKKGTFTVPMPKVTDNIDTKMPVTINGKKSATNKWYPVHSTKYTYATHDWANVFGYKSLNNKISASTTVNIIDTTKPVIKDVDNWYTECAKGKTVNHKKASCYDDCDGSKGAQTGSPARFTATSQKKVTVSYSCTDSSKLSATKTSTTVDIRDTTRPVIHYTGNHIIEHSAGTTMEKSNYLAGHFCRDTCVSDFKLEKSKTLSHIQFLSTGCTHSTKSTHAKSYFNTLKPGTYYQKFTCSDGNGNDAISKCRTIINKDKKDPILTILGDDIEYLEATYTENYVDDGATCSDQVDGIISQDVEVSGDVVNMAKRGTYKINYNCKDAAGNTATQLTRTVHVNDVTCPTCKLAITTIKREASFPYNDNAPVCTDDIKVVGKAATKGKVDVETVATYKLTYTIMDEAGNNNMGKCPACKNYKGKKCKGAKAYIRTVIVKDTLKPTIHLSFGSKTFHKSSAADTGINSQANPSGKLMAETSSVNGWVIGAIASAVAGVALLALGSKKVATSVPV